MSSPNPIQTFHIAKEAECSFAYAQATSHKGMLYVSGTLSLDESFTPVGEDDMSAQLQHAYSRIRTTLQAHGTDFSQVLKETLFVTDMDAMLAANGVRAEVYAEHTPACTIVEVSRLAFPACMVEIELVACCADN